MNTSKLLLATLIAAASTTALAAEDTTTVEIEVGQYYFDFEDTAASFVAPSTPYGEAPGDVDDAGGAITIGWMISDDWNMKLHLYKAEGESTETEPSPTSAFGMMRVDGSSAFSNGTGGPSLGLGWETDISYQGLDIMFGTPILESDLQTLSLYGSVNLARLEQDHSFYSSPLVGVSLGDKLDTTYIGVGVGLDHILNITDALKLTGNLRVDALQAKTDLDAIQNLFGVYTVSDSDDDIVGRAVAKIGLAWDFGAVSVGVNAFAQYLSDVATAEHPITEGVAQRSSIGGEDGTIYGYNATVSVEF